MAASARRRGFSLSGLPEPNLPEGSIAALTKRYGRRVPLRALYAANSVTEAEAGRMLNKAKRDELVRRRALAAEHARARRQDEWAAERGYA